MAKPQKAGPGASRARRKDPPAPEWVYRQQIAHMEEYLSEIAHQASVEECLTERGLRRRADGSPSAQRPQAVVPLKYWAAVMEAPVVHYDQLPSRLERYRARLDYLKRRGLYQGPTELTVVNREGEPDGGQT